MFAPVNLQLAVGGGYRQSARKRRSQLSAIGDR